MFPPLAESQRMNFKTPWQQYVRPNGELIEDVGVTSEIIVRPTLQDIKRPREWSSQIHRIARTLFGTMQNRQESTAQARPRRPRRPVPSRDHRLSSVPPAQIFEQEQEECVACQEAEKDTIISPCGHFCLCRACCDKLDNCPMCREPIDCVVSAESLFCDCLDEIPDLDRGSDASCCIS